MYVYMYVCMYVCMYVEVSVGRTREGEEGIHRRVTVSIAMCSRTMHDACLYGCMRMVGRGVGGKGGEAYITNEVSSCKMQ
jgi:hypothetical protein